MREVVFLPEQVSDREAAPIDRAGKHVVYDEYGELVRIELMHEPDRCKRVVPKTYVVVYDTYERRVHWMHQHLILTFDVGGEWELALLNSDHDRIVVACGAQGWFETMGQDIPAFQVADLPGLIKKISGWVLRYGEQHLTVS